MKTETELCDLECVPCRGGVPPLTPEEADALLQKLGGGWKNVDNHHLTKSFDFPDFATALTFVNHVGEVAEAEGHHPDLALSWGKVVVDIWTHKIDGLSESDFILAAKVDRAHEKMG